jgi:type IV conjugative transfer system coupling protein TraD
MLKNLISKAKGIAAQVATPENLAKAKEMAQKAADHVQSKGQTQAQKHAAAITDRHISAAVKAMPGADVHRGTVVVDCTQPAMVQKLKAKTGDGQIAIGGVPIDAGDEQQHILLCGAPGTGKSVEIKKALRTIRKRGQRAVIYDVSGELVSLYYRPGVDHILNPFDARGEAWNPWSDAESFEYAALAKSLIPDAKGQADPFWSEAGRATLEALLMQCADLDEIVATGLSAPLGELGAIVRDAGFEGMIGPEKTFQSTRSTMAVYLRSLAMLPNVRRDDAQAFSIRRWLEADDGSWLFLSVPTRGRDALRPLVSMWLDTLVRQAMSLRPDPNRRIWLSLDELPSLNKIPSLAPALAEGRKFGLSAILGVQAYGQLQEIYGKDLAAALWGLPKTRLYLRIADAETAEHVSKEIGDQQLRRETRSESQSWGSSNSNSQGGGSSSSSSNDSSSKNEQVVIERAVLPSQVAGLPDLVGYLKTGGSEMVAKVRVEFDGLQRHGEQPEFVDQPQRPLPRYVSPAAGSGEAADATGTGREANPAPEEPANNTDHAASTTTTTEQQEATMETLMQQYNVSIEREAAKFIEEYGSEFIANLDESDIDAFAEILAERVDLQQQNAAQEA